MLYLKSIAWSPLVLRAMLGFCIAVVAEFVLKTDGVKIEELSNPLTVARLAAGIILPGLMYLAGFVDQSLARHKAKHEPPPIPNGKIDLK